MRGSPFLMPVYGAGWLFGRSVRFREAVGCIVAGAGALPLVLASGGLCESGAVGVGMRGIAVRLACAACECGSGEWWTA